MRLDTPITPRILLRTIYASARIAFALAVIWSLGYFGLEACASTSSAPEIIKEHVK